MNKKDVDSEEMEMRKDKDILNSKKMVDEGGPLAKNAQAAADAESARAKEEAKKENKK